MAFWKAHGGLPGIATSTTPGTFDMSVGLFKMAGVPIRISCYTANVRRIMDQRGLKISGELVKAMFFMVEFML